MPSTCPSRSACPAHPSTHPSRSACPARPARAPRCSAAPAAAGWMTGARASTHTPSAEPSAGRWQTKAIPKGKGPRRGALLPARPMHALVGVKYDSADAALPLQTALQRQFQGAVQEEPLPIQQAI